MVTYHVGIQGLEERLDSSLIYIDQEFYSEDNLPANVNWQEVTVASEQDMDKWIEAKNRWLSAAWTPNQSPDEREENSLIMREQMVIMSSLESRGQ